MRFVRNPSFDPKHIPGVREHLAEAGRAVGEQAESIASAVSSSYRTRVEDDGDKVRVVAESRSLDAAGWIEFGTAKLPASAPLRRGAEMSGLDFRGLG